MSKHTRLKRRGAVYYFRVKIPADLVEHYGKREILESLGTKDPKEALRKVRKRSEEQEQEFDRIRSGRHITELSDAQIQALADEHFVEVLWWDQWSREKGLSQRDYDAIEAGIDHVDDWLPEALATGDITNVEHLVRAVLKHHGVTIKEGSEDHRRLGYAMLKAVAKANDVIRERHAGSIVETPEKQRVQLATVSKGKAAELDDVLTKWAAERQPRAKTLHEWSMVVRKFTEQHGAMPVSAIEKAHVILYKDKLVEGKRAAGTIRKHLGALHSLLEYAHHNGMCDKNAASGVRYQGPKVARRTREHIPVEDLRKLFDGGVFTKGERPAAGKGDAAFFLPLLGLFTGARLEELGQLSVSDVKRAHGVDYIELTDQGEAQRLKNKGSRRSVPIHPALLRLGFLKYVETRRKEGDERLFPLLKQDRHGSWTQNWSKWWGRYRKELGVTERWKDFHAFRHTFKRQCRECGIAKDIHDALTGHESGDVGDAYGGAYPLKALAGAMSKLEYPGLDLRQVQRTASRKDGAV